MPFVIILFACSLYFFYEHYFMQNEGMHVRQSDMSSSVEYFVFIEDRLPVAFRTEHGVN